MAGEGLYLMALGEAASGVPEAMMGRGDGKQCFGLEHPQAVVLLEQFSALTSIEARNAYGDALRTLAELVATGGILKVPQ